MHGEHDGHRAEHDSEAPGQRRRRAADANRAGNDRSGGEHEPRRDGEADQQEDRGHRSISERTSPVPSQRAASRYIAPLSPRTILPRITRPAPQQRPHLLGLLGAVVLEEEAHVTAQVVTVEAAPVRGAADVDAARLRREQRLPAGLREAVEPVDLLAEEEEARVRQADLVDRSAAHEQAGAHHALDLALGGVVEAGAVEGVQQLRARAELPQVVVLGREPPLGREATHRALQRAVEVEQLRGDDRHVRVRISDRDHLRERVSDKPGIRVQDQHPAARRDLLDPPRPACGEAAVRLLEHRDGGEPLPHELDGAVARVVVDDDGLDPLDAREALLDPRQRVVGRDDDGRVIHPPPRASHRHAPTPRAGSRRLAPRGRP